MNTERIDLDRATLVFGFRRGVLSAAVEPLAKTPVKYLWGVPNPVRPTAWRTLVDQEGVRDMLTDAIAVRRTGMVVDFWHTNRWVGATGVLELGQALKRLTESREGATPRTERRRS